MPFVFLQGLLFPGTLDPDGIMHPASARRWRRLLLEGAGLASLLVLLSPWFFPQVQAWWSGLGPIGYFALAVLCLAVLAVVVRRGRVLGWWRLAYFRQWPPFWIGWVYGLFGFALAVCLIDAPEKHSAEVLVSTLLAGYVVLGFALIEREAPSQIEIEASEEEVDGEPISQLSNDWEALQAWIDADEPIGDSRLDSFGHRNVANRMARRLREKPNTTMALIGGRGTGKTSILKLLATNLQETHAGRSKFVTVMVSLWPFSSIRAAARGILDEIVGALSKHIDTTSLARVPQAYVDAVAAVDGRLGGLLRLLPSQDDPQAIVKRISEVADAIGVQFLVCIEDVDRFSEAFERRTDSNAIERAGPLISMVSLLDDCPGMTVIVAAESLGAMFDSEKIARYVERPPRLDPDAVWRIIGFFNRKLKETVPAGTIDPSTTERQFALTESEVASGYKLMELSLRSETNPRLALVRVLESPRLLKQALRLIRDTWSQLQGEIDLDDLIPMSAVRVASPRLYWFVDDNFLMLQSLGDPLPGDEDWKSKRDTLYDGITKAADPTPHRRPEAVSQNLGLLLRTVFPEYGFVLGAKPQGFSGGGGDIYWSRFNIGARPRPRDADQPVLRDIAGWRAGDTEALLKRMAHQDQRGVVERFAIMFDPTEILKLLREVARRIRSWSTGVWSDRHAEPLIVLRRMMRIVAPDSGGLETTLIELIRELGPGDLPLAHKLHLWFGNEDREQIRALLNREQELRVCEAIQGVLLSFRRGAQLADALRNGDRYTLLWNAWGLERIKAHELTGIPFQGWEGFAAIFLQAARERPTAVTPQLLPFIVPGDPAPRLESQAGPRYSSEAAERLFGSTAILETFTGLRVDTSWDAEVQREFELVLHALGLSGE